MRAMTRTARWLEKPAQLREGLRRRNRSHRGRGCNGVVTGVSVGGTNFSEPQGLARAPRNVVSANSSLASEPDCPGKGTAGKSTRSPRHHYVAAVTGAVNTAVIALGGLTVPTEG
jgi:hypothetical protein